MSIIRTAVHAILAANLTLVAFVGLPLAAIESRGPLVQEQLDLGLGDGDDAVATAVVLDHDDLVRIGLAEPTPATETDDAGTELNLLGSPSGVVATRHSNTSSNRVRTVSHKPSTRRGSGKCVQTVEGVTAVSGSHYRIERSLVRAYTSNLDAMASLASVRQHSAHGNPDGYRLARVGCQSPLRAAGFRRGDIVHEVNGKPVTNTRQALRAFSRNRKAERLEVVVSRAGQTRTMVFELV